MKFLLSLGLVLVGLAYTQATVCKNNTDCGADECCYIKPEFEVVSRRRGIRQAILPVQPIHMHHDTGVCEKYHLPHHSCYPLETANGHCGCGSGYSCQFVPAETVSPLVATNNIARRSIFVPGPGAFQCEVK